MTSEWREVRLGEVFEVSNVRLGPHEEEPTVFAMSKYDGFVKSSEYFEKRVASEKLDGYKVVRADDWAYSTIHIDEGSIARNKSGDLGVVSPMYTILRWIGADHSPEYFELLLRSAQMLAVYGDMAQGSINRRRSLPWKTFEAISVIVPPLPEQRRTVDLIAALDEAIEAAANEAAEARRLRPLVVELMLSVHPEIQVGDLLDRISAGKSPEAIAEPPTAGQYGVLKVGAVNTWGFLPQESKTLIDHSVFTDAMRVRAGDVLMTRANTAEKVGAVCMVEQDYPELFLCDKTLRLETAASVEKAGLVAALNTPSARRQIEAAGTGTSASMKNISQPSIRNLRVRWPALRTEQESVGRVDTAFVQRTTAADEALSSMKALRIELLQCLLAGAHIIPDAYDSVLSA